MKNRPLCGCVLGMLVALTVSGCVSVGRNDSLTNGAMNDPRYAVENRTFASPNLPVSQEQRSFEAVDATDQAGQAGVYIGGGNTKNGWPATVGSMGVFQLPSPWSTVRAGVFGLDNNGIGVGGVEGGVRFHAPTRLTPYVGLSGDLGFSSLHSGISHNPYNNPKFAPNGARISTPTGLLAIVPEAGVSYWLDSSTRLNAGASYYVADGRPDFLVFGLSLEFLSWDGFDFNAKSAPPRRFRNPRTNDGLGTFSTTTQENHPYFFTTEDLSNRLATIQSSSGSVQNGGSTGSMTFNVPSIETSTYKPASNDPFAPLVPTASLFNRESLSSKPN